MKAGHVSDRRTGDYRLPESFAETWIRHPAGAIVFWGSMDSTYWDEDDILERRMFDAVYRDGLREFGKMTDYGLTEVWRQYGGAGKSKYYWETYTIFGDPSLELRTKRTVAVRLEGPEALPIGATLWIRMHEESDFSIGELRALMIRKGWEQAQVRAE